MILKAKLKCLTTEIFNHCLPEKDIEERIVYKTMMWNALRIFELHIQIKILPNKPNPKPHSHQFHIFEGCECEISGFDICKGFPLRKGGC